MKTAISIKSIFYALIAFLVITIGAYVIAFANTYTNLQRQFNNKEFSTILQNNAKLIEEQTLHAKNNLKRLKAYIKILDTKKVGRRQKLDYLKVLMATNLQFDRDQYNSYFAFESRLSQKYFGRQAYILTVHKNPENMKFEYYGNPDHAIDEIWTDPAYQTNKQEVWYHIAKLSRGPEVSPIYFDSTYMKTWLITVGLGIYLNDKFEGMVGIDILLESFFSSIEGVKIHKSGGLFLADAKTGQVLTRTTENGKKFLVFNERLKGYLYKKEGENKQNRRLAETWNEVLSKKVTSREITGTDGETYLIASYPLKHLPLTLVAYGKKGELYGVLYSNLFYFVVIGAFVVFGLSLVSFLVIKNLSGPITGLVEAMKKVRERRTHLSGEVSNSNSAENNNEQNSQDQVSIEGIKETRELGEIFNSMSRQLTRSFGELENRVQERTAELTKANEEIISLNKSLAAENLRMNAELEVTRRLQQMLLPKKHELTKIEGLDIAGFMQPAEEAGGDYYDVLEYNGHVKIGIGDVTGHGLESSVLMLMVQTAVRTLLANQENDPVRFLNILNRIIYDNIQRINTDKNLTLCLIDYREGILRISGQHEEVIVVRASGEVERLDTIDLGFPIGLEENISEFITQTELKLNTGDIAVLYSDGITEAENMQNEHFGMDRLCEIIKSERNRNANEIRRKVINELRTHIGEQKIFDDITIVILKQKEENTTQKDSTGQVA